MDLPFELDKSKVVDALSDRGASVVCVSCGKNDWIFLDNAGLLPEWSNKFPLAGVPIVVLACKNCGYVRTHSLAVLNLLSEEQVHPGD